MFLWGMGSIYELNKYTRPNLDRERNRNVKLRKKWKGTKEFRRETRMCEREKRDEFRSCTWSRWGRESIREVTSIPCLASATSASQLCSTPQGFSHPSPLPSLDHSCQGGSSDKFQFPHRSKMGNHSWPELHLPSKGRTGSPNRPMDAAV